jgi:acyl dehydratase
MFKKRISHGMLIGSLFSKVFGMDLPGEGSIYISQTLRFRRPVFLDDEIKAEVTVKELDVEKNRVYFDCIAYNQDGERVVVGEACMMPVRG